MEDAIVFYGTLAVLGGLLVFFFAQDRLRARRDRLTRERAEGLR